MPPGLQLLILLLPIPVLAPLLQSVFHACNCMPDMLQLYAVHASYHTSCSSHSGHGTQDFIECQRTSRHLCYSQHAYYPDHWLLLHHVYAHHI